MSMESLWQQPKINIKPIKPIKPSGAPPPQSGRRGINIKKSPSPNLNSSNSIYSDDSVRHSGPNQFAAEMNDTKVMSGMEDIEFNDPIGNVLDRISEVIRKKETLVLKMGDAKHLLEYIQFLDEQTIEAINNPDPKVIYSSNEYIELKEVVAKCLDSTSNVKKRLAECKKELAESYDSVISAGTGKKKRKRKRKKKKKGGTRKNNISSIYKMGSCSANSEENFASVPLTGGRRRRRRSRRRRPRRTKKKKSKSRKKRRTVRKRRRRRRR